MVDNARSNVRKPAMHNVTISITDEAYITAEKRARQEGFGSTEVFLSDLLVSSITSDPENYDYLFTPEVIAEIDAAAAEARTGNNITLDEMRECLRAKRNVWLEKQPAQPIHGPVRSA